MTTGLAFVLCGPPASGQSSTTFELTPLNEPLPLTIMPVVHQTLTDMDLSTRNDLPLDLAGDEMETTPLGSTALGSVEMGAIEFGAIANASYFEPFPPLDADANQPGLIQPGFIQPGFIQPSAYQQGSLHPVGVHDDLVCYTNQDARSDFGIGHERVMFAPMVVSPAIAATGIEFGLHFDNGLSVPDRAEFFWAGVQGDPSVDVIDTNVRLVVGTPKLTGITQYTLRSLDPLNRPNTTGFGDMMVGVQSLLLDGKRLKVSTLFQTHLATGSVNRGLGVGHTSLQPGVLWRYDASPSVYWFGELSYWVPIGGTPELAGDVLTTGLAVSTIGWENDTMAILPTLEMRTLTFTSAGETPPPFATGGDTRRIDGTTAVEFFPGVRFSLGPSLDWGLCELGLSAGTVFADDDWFDSRIRLNLRFAR